jgi:2-iminobutanoate/2-iminopropanoate deaminase
MAELKTSYHAREGLEKSFHFAQAVKAGTTLYISGCLSWDADGNVLAPGDMAGQVRNVYDDIRKTLEAHGLSFASVVKENVFTTDMDALVEAAGERARFLEGVEPYAATWVEVKRLVNPDLLIEIEVTAILPQG